MGRIVLRRDIRDLSKQELDNLVRAFEKIQKLEPDHPDSFFSIASLHGLPFRGGGYTNPAWWGGYCNHGNVLFPTWHRAYLHRLEQALQKQVSGVALPYWDELEDLTIEHRGENDTTKRDGEGADARKNCIPDVFMKRKYTFADGEIIENPLFSYTFPRTVFDTLAPNPGANYTKPKDYRTVRYPFSGLVGTDQDRAHSKLHNQGLVVRGEIETNNDLNENVQAWLNLEDYTSSDATKRPAGVKTKYKECLNAPNYTVFSNTTSADRWNDDRADIQGAVTAVSLESPHNSIHLALGGFDVPNVAKASKYPYANGDMGENDTASFDPIFYFHHCFIDLMFWRWQVRHDQTMSLDIMEGYPGTNSVDSQGPTPGVAGGTWLTMDSPLEPFKRPGDSRATLTSNDVVDPARLGYAYEVVPIGQPGYYDDSEPPEPVPVLMVEEVDRARIAGGSFVISAWAVSKDGKEKDLVGTEAVLSRRHVAGCRNCQTHLEVRPHMPLYGWDKEDADKADFIASVETHKVPGDGGGRDGGRDYSDSDGWREQDVQRPVCKVSFGHLARPGQYDTHSQTRVTPRILPHPTSTPSL